jgi:hypothetical protein
MKKKLIIFLALGGLMFAANAQPYGQYSYPYGGNYFVCTGFRTSLNSTGHLMAAFEQFTGAGGYNFIINKAGGGGAFGPGSNPIRTKYQMVHDPTCGTNLVPINNCEGVSVIETNIPGPLPQWYAVAGVFDRGCFFATLSQTGGPGNLKQYLFPSPQNFNGKPLLIESNVTANTYYIVGKYDDGIYILHVNSIGNVLWQQMYTLGPGSYLEPRSMIMAPAPSGELVIVGKASENGGDGFFMKLNGSNGNINLFKTYGFATKVAQTDQYFTDILTIGTWPNNEYVISGWNDPTFTLNTPWIIKLDNGGNIIWSRVIAPAVGTMITDVPALAARLNPTTSLYEYYVITYNPGGAGIIVIKTDQNGLPFPTGPNQFDFDANRANYSRPTEIDVKTVSPNIALTTYCTDDGIAGGDPFMTRSYFNGVTGCNTVQVVCCDYPGPSTISTPTPVPHLALTPCGSFDLLRLDATVTPVPMCSSSSVSGGSNARQITPEIGEEEVLENSISAFPNPTSRASLLTYYVPNDGVKVYISLYNHLGQRVGNVSSDMKAGGKQEQVIDFESLGLEAGIYFVSLTVDGKTSNVRVVYMK